MIGAGRPVRSATNARRRMWSTWLGSAITSVHFVTVRKTSWMASSLV